MLMTSTTYQHYTRPNTLCRYFSAGKDILNNGSNLSNIEKLPNVQNTFNKSNIVDKQEHLTTSVIETDPINETKKDIPQIADSKYIKYVYEIDRKPSNIDKIIDLTYKMSCEIFMILAVIYDFVATVCLILMFTILFLNYPYLVLLCLILLK